MENKKEMTIPNVSAATDAEQSLSKCTDNSIVNQDTDFKGYEQSFEEMQREILRQLDPSYLKTVSMTTLYDTVFEVQTPLSGSLLIHRLSKGRQKFYDGTACLSYQHRHTALGV